MKTNIPVKQPTIGQDYEGQLDLISYSPYGENPILFLLLSSIVTVEEEVPSVEEGDEPIVKIHQFMVKGSHATRLGNEDAKRIGLTEIANAFPTHFKDVDISDPDNILAVLLSKTSDIEGSPLRWSCEAQIDRNTGIPAKSESGVPYFNIRLRSGARNLSMEDALKLIKGGATKAPEVGAGSSLSSAIDAEFESEAKAEKEAAPAS